MKRPATPGGIILYGLPHHQVVPTETLPHFVRSAVFKNRLLANVKKHRARHGSSSLARQQDNAFFPGQDMFMNLEEKPKRLRRKAMFLSCPALQSIELAYGLQILQDFHGQPELLRFANRPAH